MDGVLLYVGIALLVVAGLTVQFVITRRRHGRDHRRALEPVLKSHGLTFVSANWPGSLKVGPFPKVEVEVCRPQSRVGGISGEYDEYRIVNVRDSDGNTHQLWAKLEFELFRLRRIRWRAEDGQNIPSQARALLED